MCQGSRHREEAVLMTTLNEPDLPSSNGLLGARETTLTKAQEVGAVPGIRSPLSNPLKGK